MEDEPPSTLLIVHDVTDLIESENARERLFAIVSHELRNPLTAILGHVDLALEDPTLTQNTREQLEVIDSAGERMQYLISDILTASQREEAAASRPSLVDLHTIIAASMESFHPAAVLQGVRVSADLSGELPVTGDGFRLRQVIDNVLSNAIKYTPRDGTVEISGRATAQR